jgi:release factor glutamine methyltransferase
MSKHDVLRDSKVFLERYDAIVSNPPYIPSQELPSLMREVQHEPCMALDGGDGFLFYRVIADEWVKKLNPGGFCAVEIGFGQANTVAALFEQAGLQNICINRDYGGVERVVCGFTKTN